MDYLRCIKRIKLNNKGFTLMELVVTLAMIGILAAILVPSILGFVENGRQRNRMNIARTIYLAMQNELSQSMLEKNLKSTLTGIFYNTDGSLDTSTTSPMMNYNVARMLGSSASNGLYPTIDAENEAYVVYVMKPKGFIRGADSTDPTVQYVNQFYDILDKFILDKTILNETILVEYNIETGVVLSAFYGDTLTSEQAFTYTAGAGNSNVIGHRGMGAGGYEYFKARKQGYYGVNFTGVVSPEIHPHMIHIYDGANRPLSVASGSTNSATDKVNVLYVEFKLPSIRAASGAVDPAAKQGMVDLSIISTDRSGVTLLSYPSFDPSKVPLSFYSSLLDLENRGMYYSQRTAETITEYGIRYTGFYDTYIWIIDYIDGDIYQGQPHSIYHYSDQFPEGFRPQNARAQLTYTIAESASSKSAVSNTIAHTHFNRDLSGSLHYEITTARHLNNMRFYNSAGYSYRLTTDIDMQLPENVITNFMPIRDFEAKFFGMASDGTQFMIQNLVIDTTGSGFTADSTLIDPITKAPYAQKDHVGLFANIIHDAQLTGVSLFNASISTTNASNVGAIVGVMGVVGDHSPVLEKSNSYANVIVSGNGNGGVLPNVGGLVGSIVSGTVDQCFNAGFFDTHSSTSSGVGSVLSDRGNIGGLVGWNAGVISNSFNNARVNIVDAELSTDGLLLSMNPVNKDLLSSAVSNTYLGGITGRNLGTIANVYATNFVAIYETIPTQSGGIVGDRINIGSMSNVAYIMNTCTDDGAISKDDLIKLTATLGNVFDDGFTQTDAENHYKKTSGTGTIGYPYPILKSNQQFSRIDESIILGSTYGWEDIQSEIIEAGALFYAEVYSNGTFAYSNSKFNTNVNIISSSTDVVVTADGYGIELQQSLQGYTLAMYLDGSTTPSIFRMSFNNGTWTIADQNGNVLSPQWVIKTEISAKDGKPFYRIFFPNDLIRFETMKIDLYVGDKLSLPITQDPLYSSTEFSPLFAEARFQKIRSPRHFVNIDYNDSTRSGVYYQQLNLNFGNYRTELALSMNGNQLIANAGKVLPTFPRGVVYAGPFRGSYNGAYNNNPKVIENLVIGSEATTLASRPDNVGLFSINESLNTISNVTLRDFKVFGRDSVGAIAGINNGRITNVSVQQVASSATDITTHPVTVQGRNDVGGIVGINNGILQNVAVVSTSSRPFVGGTSRIGGVIGTNNQSLSSNVDYIQYLAVAPVLSNTLFPYQGSGSNVGSNTEILSANFSIYPFRTRPITTNTSLYNFQYWTIPTPLPAPIQMNGLSSILLHQKSLFSSLWSKTTTSLTGQQVVSVTNRIYPYQYPTNTVIPVYGVSEPTWPIADTIALSNAGIVYYEMYSNGTFGVFTREFLSETDNTIVEKDFLDPFGIIIEAGYAVMYTGTRPNPGNMAGFAHSNDLTNNTGATSWGQIFGNNISNSITWLSEFNITGLSQRFAPLTPSTLRATFNSFTTTEGLSRLEPFYIWINSANGANMSADPFGVASINPLFAKAVYPVRVNTTVAMGTLGIINSTPSKPLTHSIRTLWQFQNINLIVPPYAPPNIAEQTFSQENNLDFSRIITSQTFNNTNTFNTNKVVTGSGYNPETIINGNNVVNNVISAPLYAMYQGNSLQISNLNLQGTSTNSGNNKSLFISVSPIGRIQGVVIRDFILTGGQSHAHLVSINEGTITDITVLSTANLTTNGPFGAVSNAAGIVYTNNNVINNTLYIAKVPGSFPIWNNGTGSGTNNYYLSGTVGAISPLTSTTVTSALNTFDASQVHGTPLSTQEINYLSNLAGGLPTSLSNMWSSSVVSYTNNTLTSTGYPYPYLGSTVPLPNWLVATTRAERLVYFEVYSDQSMGFFYNPSTVTGLKSLPSLVDGTTSSLTIIDSGYAVIVPKRMGYTIKQGTTGNNIFMQTTAVKSYTYNSADVYYIPIPQSLMTSGRQQVEIQVNDLPLLDAANTYFNSNFAKGVYGSSTPPNSYVIRTPRQMMNINNLIAAGLDLSGITFVQNYSLDFELLTRGLLNTSLIQGVFTGNFIGNTSSTRFKITNVYINSTQDNIGLFSINDGLIDGLKLEPSINVVGNDNVGAIAGINDGTIQNCNVTGMENPSGSGIYTGIDITGNLNVGGIVGLNNGTILNSTFNNSTASIKGSNYVGPIAGRNSVTGSITGVSAKNVALVLNGINYGLLVGLDESAPSKVSGIAENIFKKGSNNTLAYDGRPIDYFNLVYYELYEDDTYGFQSIQTDTLLPPLDNKPKITEWGYALLHTGWMNSTLVANDMEYLLTDVVISDATTSYQNIKMTKLFDLQANRMNQVKVTGLYQQDRLLGQYHSYFAGVNNTTNSFLIRTPEQLMNISKVNYNAADNMSTINSRNLVFIQNRDLDFEGTILQSAVVTGEFEGIYEGASYAIHGVNIQAGFNQQTINLNSNAEQDIADEFLGVDDVGLFSINSGTIKNVSLIGTRDNPIHIIGRSNVGGLVGQNIRNSTTGAFGVIQNCIIQGTMYSTDAHGNPQEPTYEGVIIQGVGGTIDRTGMTPKPEPIQCIAANVGGIAGYNEGIIDKSYVRDTDIPILGDNYVGGFVGYNTATGIILIDDFILDQTTNQQDYDIHILQNIQVTLSGERVMEGEQAIGNIFGLNDNPLYQLDVVSTEYNELSQSMSGLQGLLDEDETHDLVYIKPDPSEEEEWDEVDYE